MVALPALNIGAMVIAPPVNIMFKDVSYKA